jgi:hypothetical protein
MNTKNLLKEAIADAKTVRETALAQAKLVLEEAFTPRLQSMLATKLQEMEDDEMKEAEYKMDEAKDEMVDEVEAERAKEKMEEMEDMESYDDDDNSIDEIDLDEILAELNDEMDADKKSEMNEAKDDDAEEMEDEEAEEDTEDDEMDAEEDVEEEKEVSELSMDELEELIRDIVSQEMGPDGEGDVDIDASAEETIDGLPDTTDDEVNLDEILAELLGEDEDMDKLDKVKETKSLNESITDLLTLLAGSSGIALTGIALTKAQDLLQKNNPTLYAKLQDIDATMSKAKGFKKEGVEDYKKEKKMEEELQLALEAITTLRHELQEVNLLNAKLLYVNKIFKAKNLTESQKLKVIKSFDKAESAKEAKLVFESLSETFVAKTGKNQIKESLGFASKAAGIAPQKSTIVEGNDFIARMQKLANIK